MLDFVTIIMEQFTPSKFEDKDFLPKFRESFAVYVEDMITDPRHSADFLKQVALGKSYEKLPEVIRNGTKKLNIESWEGDAFATVLQQYRPISEKDYERLRKEFFFN